MIVGVASFTRSRLTLARERRGLTQRELSDAAGVSDRMIKAYESGDKNPTPETLATISNVLGFPLAFFEKPPPDNLTLEAASFRALTKASATLRNRTVAAGTIAMEFHNYLADKFEMRTPNIPDLRNCTPERAAESVRHMWGVGQQPIPNVVNLLELHGARVFSLSEDCDAIDAFSVWRNGIPFVFLNNRKTPERGIFDAAHELGHLTLHRHGSPQGRDAEKEADAFAACFIMPESGIRASAPSFPTISTIAAMKKTWRASVAALGHRLHELGLMSTWHYKHFNIELTRRGRQNEPNPLARETSMVLRKALATLAEDGYGIRDIARELALPVSELQSLSFGMHAIEGGHATSGARRGSLRPVR
jgi:Zn-dependent peptidase ImmA (M78 family)/DNA-binding XRE family transcriptional regulator